MKDIEKYTMQMVGGNKTDDKPNILAQAVQPTNTDADSVHRALGNQRLNVNVVA